MRIFLHSARVLLLLPLALFALLAGAQPAPLPFDTQDPELRDAFRAFLIDLLREDADSAAALVEVALDARPELVMQAAERYQQQAESARVAQTLEQYRDLIFDSPTSPVLGNPDGDVTIVEFFDYRCSYCRRMMDPLLDLVEADGNIRLIFKEFPILGPDSVEAAIAALAAQEQGRYLDAHRAFMSSTALDEASIRAIAEELQLDLPLLFSDMEESVTIAEELQLNQGLAEALGISGTPALLIGDRLVLGLTDEATLQTYLLEARLSGSGVSAGDTSGDATASGGDTTASGGS